MDDVDAPDYDSILSDIVDVIEQARPEPPPPVA